MHSEIVRAARLLMSATSVCASTGAGMSAESGLSTFRDADGLWSRFDPSELATPQAFARDPRKVWRWYRWRRTVLATVRPHLGHRVLAGWETRVRDFAVVTQNVDGLHHRAGSRNVIELHGRLDSARCTRCAYATCGLEDLGELPACPACGSWLRPGVVWFGERLPQHALEAAFSAAGRCDVLLLIGTSGLVQPAASLVPVARQAGAHVVEINPNESALSDLATIRIRADCGSALGAIDDVWQRAC